MRPFPSLICLLIAGIIFTGCEENVYAPLAKSPYPVVYCILNADDSAHYLSLTKSFSGPVDAYVMAQNPDSLYYKNARVLAGWCGGLTEMQLTDEISRDPGVFFSGYSLLYKSKVRFKGSVNFHIYLPDYGTEIMGGTSVMGPPVVWLPDPVKGKVLGFYEEHSVQVQWDGVKGVCQTVIRFKYLEITNSGMDTCHLDWTRKSADFAIIPQDLLNFFQHWIKDRPEVKYRKVLGFDFLLSTGNETLANYVSLRDWSIDFIDRPYSNLVNAYGLIASRVSLTLKDYIPNQKFIDTLVNSKLTEYLRFVSW